MREGGWEREECSERERGSADNSRAKYDIMIYKTDSNNGLKLYANN